MTREEREEQYARIIDPLAFKYHPNELPTGRPDQRPYYREAALAKARQLLDLPVLSVGGGGEDQCSASQKPTTSNHAGSLPANDRIGDNLAERLAEALRRQKLGGLYPTAILLEAAEVEGVIAMAEALDTFAILANDDTAYLPDEHVISLTYDDSELDDDLGGPNTLLGERFMRAFRLARAALSKATGATS